MEEIFEIFSCISLMLVHHNQVSHFINHFKLEAVIRDINWIEAIEVSIEQEPISASTAAFYNIGKLIVTSEVKGFTLIQGNSVHFLGKEFCEYFSNDSDAYRFNTDIWIPAMYFEYYKDQKMIRRREYVINDSNESLESIEFGSKLEFEDELLEFPEPENGCADFYYPLKILGRLGIGINDLKSLLNTSSTVYQLTGNHIDPIKKAIEKSIEEASLRRQDGLNSCFLG